MTWDDETKPPANNSSEKEVDFELGMYIVYCDGTGKNSPAVYEELAQTVSSTPYFLKMVPDSIIETEISN